jgi:hypothetical protein
LGATRLTRRFVRSDPVRPEELVGLRVHALALLGPLADRVDEGSLLRLDLRARDTPDLWAAGQNADLFESEFGRRLVPVAAEVA